MSEILRELWRGVVVAELSTEHGQAFWIGGAAMTLFYFIDEPWGVLLMTPFWIIAAIIHIWKNWEEW